MPLSHMQQVSQSAGLAEADGSREDRGRVGGMAERGGPLQQNGEQGVEISLVSQASSCGVEPGNEARVEYPLAHA